jgi:hypothetical protein
LTFAGGQFLIDWKIVLGLGNCDVVLTAFPGKKVKKWLTDLCKEADSYLAGKSC